MFFLFCLCNFALTSTALSQNPAEKENPKSVWIVVTTPEFEGHLEPLVARRKQQGFEVIKILPRDLGDQWSSTGIREKIAKLSDQFGKSATNVLLVGDWVGVGKPDQVPSAVGKHGRMAGLPSDLAYSLPDSRGLPSIAVGRFPARTAEDVAQFVAKVIRFEDQEVGPWTNRMNLWVGHPGGDTAIEKRLGETIIQSAVNKSLSQLDSAWHGNCSVDFPNTPFSVSRQEFRDRMRDELSQGQCFTIYAGHSTAEGIWSEDQFVFARDEWSSIQIQSSPGIVLTTGCFACQMQGLNGRGFLTQSLYNPAGPVACMGAYAESYAAHGQLALDAFVELVSRPKPPSRLGEFWLAIAAGIGSGKMDALTFWLYDQADGSRGAVPLDQQRLEHLEMWTLLGDPALRVPFLEPKLRIEVMAGLGSPDVTVELDVPDELLGGTCELQFQFRSISKKRSQAIRMTPPISSLHQLDANSKFVGKLKGLDMSTDGELRVRAMVLKDGRGAIGVASKAIKQTEISR